MNHTRFQSLIRELYRTVSELETMFPGRHFTPDGHMVGSIGECLVADAYGLNLQTASNKSFDATSENGLKVEIKATQSKRVAFRSCPEHAIVIKIDKNGNFEEIYNGSGARVYEHFTGKSLPSNGQYQISISKLRQLQGLVPNEEVLPKIEQR
ncbi:hypothetical protein C4C99_RS07950 [Vibrio parahaemolyticus]|nr:hypothetical protein [Vibrio parahaemolyticus]EGQ8279362.1 hypothetical protein [Vibrio parahaemolyticus]EGQ8717767.1 hypothetical protein [Vibrio parahaemolyticus]EGQ8811518.1 hypothetical protein [Vibrio parahaemolyticus]EGQ8836985.1 hypothetical protein [Vibrio parahaemolyticus]